jgi:ribosomal protein S18 acetylase RimI-like enzyme
MSFLAELLVAATGAVAAVVFTRFQRVVSDYRLRHKYPVSGRYITKYGDMSGSTSITSKAPAVLTQKGLSISGETTDLDGRTWLLYGTIEEGFINGGYKAQAPSDDSRGTFFVSMDGRHGDMKGKWAGWDSVNSEIGGGEYMFRRVLDLIIRTAAASEVSTICALLGDALGDFYVDLKTVEEAVSGADSRCIVAEGPQGEIMGAATFYIVNRSSFARFLPLGQEHLLERLRELRFNERVGLLRSIAVRQDYRDRGIATSLMDNGIEWCEDEDATVMLTVAWAPADGCHLCGVLTAARFTEVMRIANYWTEDSQQQSYDCPVCGAVCQCGAIIFKRELDGRQRGSKVATKEARIVFSGPADKAGDGAIDKS